MPVVPTARTKAASGLRLCVYARWLFYKLKRLSAWMVAFTHRFSTSLRFGTMQYTAPLLHHSFRLYRVVFPCENPYNSLSVELYAVCISLPRTWSRVLQSRPTFCYPIFCCLKAPCHNLTCSALLGIGIFRCARHSLGLLTGKPVGFLPGNIPGYCIDLVGIRTLVRVELKDIAGLA